MKSIFVLLILLGSIFWISTPELLVVDSKSVNDVLEDLGEFNAKKKPDYSIRGVSALAGEKLVKEGIALKANGKKTKKQSKHFVCTSCHNVVKEDINLANPDPQKRLEYAYEVGIPFLQGSTLYGAVNRETYYNGDYDKKYGDLVKPARNDIREAIQLCAVECAQGRKLDTWEVESILAYMWEIELQMEDLIFSPEELKSFGSPIMSNVDRQEKKQLLKAKYLPLADAHFVVPPFDRSKGYENITRDPFNGKLIYENSCLHCHENQRYSFLHLDNTKMSFKFLSKKIKRYHPYSIYQVTRWGVPSKLGKHSYMPQYTEEKMTNQQLEDLRAYIEESAN